jgi:glycosyltransferase involved in cell wall biosynthesis
VFLYSGNMGMAHEFETLVEAAVRLRERGDIHFAFVGGGARLPEIQRSVDERQLSNVSFHPWVPQDRLRDGLTAGDVHLVTLRDDLWGYLVPSKVYGVLAAGRPTIFVGPEKSYVVELIREGQCGFESRVGDVDALVRSVTSYADDASLRATHGERARSRFEERYDREIALERFSKLVERIAPIGRAGQA